MLIDTLAESEKLQRLAESLDKLSVGDLYKTVLPKGLIHELRRLVKSKRLADHSSHDEQTDIKISVKKPNNERTTLQKGQMTAADFNALAAVFKNGILMKDDNANGAEQVIKVLDNDLYDEIEEDDEERLDEPDDDSVDDSEAHDDDHGKTSEGSGSTRGDGIVDAEALNQSINVQKAESEKTSDADGYVSDQPTTITDTKVPVNPSATVMKPSKRNLKFNDNLMTSSNINRNVNFSANYVDSHTLLQNLLQSYFG